MTEKRFTKQEVYDGINRYQINDSNFIVEILDEGIPMHYSTIVNRLNEQHKTITRLEKENEQLKSTIKEVTELLSDEVDLFSDEATEHDINAYMELKELDNKDAFYMATATKKAIRMLKELEND